MSQLVVNMIRRGQATELAALVVEEPAAARARDAQGVSMLMWSVYARQPQITECLRGAAGDLDVFEASALGDCGRLQAILKEDAMQARAISPDGWAPLHLASAFAGPDAVKLLLEHGAHVHQISHNAQRNQPLHSAVALSQSTETITLLLQAAADVNAVQAGGFTPLHQAAAAGKSEIVALLLKSGARRDCRCDQGKLPLDYARERGNKAAEELLSRETASGAR